MNTNYLGRSGTSPPTIERQTASNSGQAATPELAEKTALSAVHLELFEALGTFGGELRGHSITVSFVGLVQGDAPPPAIQPRGHFRPLVRFRCIKIFIV
ncbi:MAG: hypothetical protein SNJ82_03070 [Gemmataceae bacterium]